MVDNFVDCFKRVSIDPADVGVHEGDVMGSEAETKVGMCEDVGRLDSAGVTDYEGLGVGDAVGVECLRWLTMKVGLVHLR